MLKTLDIERAPVYSLMPVYIRVEFSAKCEEITALKWESLNNCFLSSEMSEMIQ